MAKKVEVFRANISLSELKSIVLKRITEDKHTKRDFGEKGDMAMYIFSLGDFVRIVGSILEGYKTGKICKQLLLVLIQEDQITVDNEGDLLYFK